MPSIKWFGRAVDERSKAMNFELDRSLDEFRELTKKALWHAKMLGATHAEVRINVSESERLSTEGFGDGSAKINSVGRSVSETIGVRVIVHGTWGFSSGSLSNGLGVEEIVRRAVNIAEANATLQRHGIHLAPITVASQPIFYTTPCVQDPFDVPLDKKVDLLLTADKLMGSASARVFRRNGALSFHKSKKILETSDGVFAVQEFMESGASIEVHTRHSTSDDAQRRSYPDAHVHLMRGGWEQIEEIDILKHAEKITGEAEELLSAPYCPQDVRDIILLQTQANLHCGHETIHGFEADRVLGWEWTLAGGSFITPILSEIGNYQFGSEHVNIVADSLDPRGVGTFACDDEGVPGQKNYLVKNGVLVGLLTSRETVPVLNRRIGRDYFKSSGGTMRAMGAGSPPLIRMVNIIIEPGSLSFEEMTDKAPQGTIMFGTNKSWSIDAVRRHFNFGTEIAWEKVRNTWEPRKNGRYAGDNLAFFRSCQGFADEKSFFMAGIGNCGKDTAPVQSIPTGHGSSPGWFKNIKVGSVGRMKGGA